MKAHMPSFFVIEQRILSSLEPQSQMRLLTKDVFWFGYYNRRPSRLPSTNAANKEDLNPNAITPWVILLVSSILSFFIHPEHLESPQHQYTLNMALLRFDDLPPIVQALLRTGCLNWGFVPPPATTTGGLPSTHPVGTATGGRGQGRDNTQRPIAAGGNWLPIVVPNGVMATGAEGIVHLWCDVDPHNGQILDRIVVKNVVMGSVRYLDRDNWAGRHVGGEPLECQQANAVWLATAQADRQHIQDCLGWGDVVPPLTPQDQQKYRYKLYHEYCAHKNLDKVMKNQPKKKKKGAAKKGKKQFPEPFLWYMFESLAKACVGMNAAHTNVGVVHQ